MHLVPGWPRQARPPSQEDKPEAQVSIFVREVCLNSHGNAASIPPCAPRLLWRKLWLSATRSTRHPAGLRRPCTDCRGPQVRAQRLWSFKYAPHMDHAGLARVLCPACSMEHCCRPGHLLPSDKGTAVVTPPGELKQLTDCDQDTLLLQCTYQASTAAACLIPLRAQVGARPARGGALARRPRRRRQGCARGTASVSSHLTLLRSLLAIETLAGLECARVFSH